jgi:hypothetical protein
LSANAEHALFGNASAVGRVVFIGDDLYHVVGVVKSARPSGPGSASPHQVYLLDPRLSREMTVIVKHVTG